MNDPDDRLTVRQLVLGGLFVIAFSVIVSGLFLLASTFTRETPATTTPSTATTVAPSTTTTTEPYANLRASLNDYCAAKGWGRASITVSNGAPIGGCSGG